MSMLQYADDVVIFPVHGIQEAMAMKLLLFFLNNGTIAPVSLF
jgi:hypothetical protein